MILERAIQLDAQRPGDTTLAELQRVAQELNVSSGSLMEAIRELQTKAVTPPPATEAKPAAPVAVEPPLKRSWWRTAAIALGSMAFAAFNVGDSPGHPEPSVFLLFFASIALIIAHRRSRTPRAYQRDLLALFGGVVLGWVISDGRDTEAVVYLSTFSWMFASTVGGWLTRWRRRGHDSATEPAPQS